MSQHTPGPWDVGQFGYSKKGVKFSRTAVRTRGGGYITTEVLASLNGTPEGNAHLIAAAPDLLEAFEKIIKYRDTVSASGFQLEKLDDYIEQGRAAIAKAKGGTA